MPVNTLFTPTQIEKDLLQTLASEVIYQKGFNVIYLPREIVNLDTIINEDIQSKFSQSFTIEAYDEDMYGNAGKGNVQNIFGSAIFDKKTISISRQTWNTLIGANLTGNASVRPFEGDLIYIPMKKSLYQISFVEHEDPFYNLEFNPFYKLTLDMFEYSQDIFETGNSEIDDFQNLFDYSVVLKIKNGIGEFSINDNVYQNITSSVTITAKVTKIQVDTNTSKRIITLTNIISNNEEYQSFVNSENPLIKLFSENGLKSWVVEKVFTNDTLDNLSDKNKIMPNNLKSDNAETDFSASSLISYQERNT